MNSQPGSSHRISRIFFISILAAASIYGIAITIESVSAGELLPSLITFAIIVSAFAATAVLRIPRYFAVHFSGTTISVIAIAVSTLGLLLAISDAAAFVRLPEHILASPGAQSLRTVSTVGVASFGLALIVNGMAALIVPRKSSRSSS